MIFKVCFVFGCYLKQILSNWFCILKNNFLRFDYKFLVLFAISLIINISKTHTHQPWQENTFKLCLHSNPEKYSLMTLKKYISVGSELHPHYRNLKIPNHVNKPKSNHKTKWSSNVSNYQCPDESDHSGWTIKWFYIFFSIFIV